MKQVNMKTPLVFRVAVLLLCLLLISSYMLGGRLYARYITTDYSSDSARVASFAFSDDLNTKVQTLVLDASMMYPGKTLNTTAAISNNGEVALRYIVTVENLTGNLPIEYGELGAKTLYPGESSNVTIALEWPAEKSSVEYVGKMDVLRISVLVEQVD
ncbi:MAG: hypothetical protein IKU55_05105 [Clostridia bacterium]|nr:hypothetical protein [Clostridia bacterium]